MKQTQLGKLSNQELLQRFVRIAIAQDEALLDDAYGRYNRLYQQMSLIDRELRARGRQERLSLVALFDHPNVQVRLKAATKLLGVVPEQARKVLERIIASREFPQAGDAGMLIRGLDDGSFVPDWPSGRPGR